MKAPDKIFIKPGQIKVEMIPGGELPNVGIQYIRKDAILEWANKRTETIPDLGFDNGDTEYGYMRAIENLIEHINSL